MLNLNLEHNGELQFWRSNIPKGRHD